MSWTLLGFIITVALFAAVIVIVLRAGAVDAAKANAALGVAVGRVGTAIADGIRWALALFNKPKAP